MHRRAAAADRGEVLLRGRRVTGPPEEMALVFQEYGRSLMPWTSVRNNVLLPLRHKKLEARRAGAARRGVARRRSASTRFIDHYPWQLSGGMQQRVAIARALAYQPSILLMDEPFASVDAQTRGDLEDLVLQVREEFGVTIVFVTHDIDESVYLSDRDRRADARADGGQGDRPRRPAAPARPDRDEGARRSSRTCARTSTG